MRLGTRTTSAAALAGVGRLFAQAGVPLPAVTGPTNVLFELVGGIAMIRGVAVPIVGVLMALNMAGAWTFVHTSGLFAMENNGPELVIALGLLGLVLAVTGSDRLGLDHLIVRRLRRRSRTPDHGSAPRAALLQRHPEAMPTRVRRWPH